MVSKLLVGWPFWFFIATVVFSVCIVCFGCKRSTYHDAPATPFVSVSLVAVKQNPYHLPPADVPVSLRYHNQGRSCAPRSFATAVVQQDQPALAAWWAARYSGPYVTWKCAVDAAKVGFDAAYTNRGDSEFLEWCSRTKRAAAIDYDYRVGEHAMTFVGYRGNVAYLIDNNFPEKYKTVPKSDFLSHWRDSGGSAATVVYTPMIPSPW